jgi:hypothetical protein
VKDHADGLLSAASLLTAVIALLYSLWYPELREATEAKIEIQHGDRGPARRLVREALIAKGLPLVAATFVQLVVFAPDAAAILSNAIRLTSKTETNGLVVYDSVQAAFLAVYLFSIALMFVATRIVYRLLRKQTDLARS